MRARTLILAALAACASSGPSVEAKKRRPPAEPAPAEPAPADPAPAPAPGKKTTAALEILDAHNAARKAHCAPALAWSDALAKEAQRWANHLRDDGCAFEHSSTDHGENLAAGTTGYLTPASAVKMWVDEEPKYNYKRGGFSMESGHFTQVVWRETRAVGCGMATCDGNDIWVCNYDPAGNVEGQFKENVLPGDCQ